MGVSLRAGERSGGGDSPRQEPKTRTGRPEKSKTPHTPAQMLQVQVQPANTGVQTLVSSSAPRSSKALFVTRRPVDPG